MLNGSTKETIFKTKMQVLLLMPVFLLVLGCALSMSTLLGVAVLLRIFLCWKYKLSYSKSIFKSKLFKLSILFMFIYLLLLLIPTLIMHGNVGEIGHYFERMLPFFLLFFVADENLDIWVTVWVAFSAGLSVICFQTLPFIFETSGRLQGIFGNPNTFGGMLALLMPILYFGIYKHQENKQTIIAGSFLLLGASILLVLTQSRGAVVSIAISVLLFFIGLILKEKWHSKKTFFYVMFILVLMTTFLAFTKGEKLHFFRDISKDGRIELLKSGENMFLAHPLLGVGVGNWMKEYDTTYGVKNSGKHMFSPHNIFLQELNEAGIIGLSGFLGLLGFQYYHLLKSAWADINSNITKLQWPFAILLTYIVTLVHGQVDYIFFQRGYQMLYWLLWGIYCWDSVYKNSLNKSNCG